MNDEIGDRIGEALVLIFALAVIVYFAVKVMA
jgi:hypothetical protein